MARWELCINYFARNTLINSSSSERTDDEHVDVIVVSLINKRSVNTSAKYVLLELILAAAMRRFSS